MQESIVIGQGNSSLYVFACKQTVFIDKLVCGCPGSKPETDGGVIILHSVFIKWIDARKNNFNKFASKERKRGVTEGDREGGQEEGGERQRERGGEKCCIYKNTS